MPWSFDLSEADRAARWRYEGGGMHQPVAEATPAERWVETHQKRKKGNGGVSSGVSAADRSAPRRRPAALVVDGERALSQRAAAAAEVACAAREAGPSRFRGGNAPRPRPPRTRASRSRRRRSPRPRGLLRRRLRRLLRRQKRTLPSKRRYTRAPPRFTPRRHLSSGGRGRPPCSAGAAGGSTPRASAATTTPSRRRRRRNAREASDAFEPESRNRRNRPKPAKPAKRAKPARKRRRHTLVCHRSCSRTAYPGVTPGMKRRTTRSNRRRRRTTRLRVRRLTSRPRRRRATARPSETKRRPVEPHLTSHSCFCKRRGDAETRRCFRSNERSSVGDASYDFGKNTTYSRRDRAQRRRETEKRRKTRRRTNVATL